MENLATKLDGTARHLIDEGQALYARTRDAGQVFVTETEKASAVFLKAARTEARSWARALRRTRGGLTPAAVARLRPALERRVLTQVDAALTAAAERVRARLVQLEPPPVRRKPAKARDRRTAKPRTDAVSIAA